MANYDITTVDWNPEQTKRWLRFVEKNCPTANITLVPNSKPIPWSWSSGKLNCFNKIYKTDRIIYLDTDTLVFDDMEFVFDVMDGNIGASAFETILSKNRRARMPIEKVNKLECRVGSPRGTYMHWNTGMVILNGYDPFRLYANWKLAFEFEEILSSKWVQSEESAFSVAMLMDKEIKTWIIPMEFHGNVIGGKRQFGSASKPSVVHYHKIKRLTDDMKKWLEVDHA